VGVHRGEALGVLSRDLRLGLPRIERLDALTGGDPRVLVALHVHVLPQRHPHAAAGQAHRTTHAAVPDLQLHVVADIATFAHRHGAGGRVLCEPQIPTL